MSTNQISTREVRYDRRQEIIEAGIVTLREFGYAGFTQPRVASRAGLRQSHITYYHPTRLDLLAAVATAAVDRQLAAIAGVLGSLRSVEAAAAAIAELVSRTDNTRVLLALAQASDEEPSLREHFGRLAGGIVQGLTAFLARLGAEQPSEDDARFLHAVAVGLAVVDLATAQSDGRRRATAILTTALNTVLKGAGPT